VIATCFEQLPGWARKLGASVLLEPRERPAEWRSVVASPSGGEIALWQLKARRPSVRGNA
jgi:hypothetical protein